MKDFIIKNIGKTVHADFINFKGDLTSAVGILSTEKRKNKNGDIETLVTIESDTDLDVIPMTNIKKIFVKEIEKSGDE